MKRLKLFFDDREVRAGLTDLAKSERVIWHASGMPEDGLGIVKERLLTRRAQASSYLFRFFC
jgi:hypothetical protein